MRGFYRMCFIFGKIKWLIIAVGIMAVVLCIMIWRKNAVETKMAVCYDDFSNEKKSWWIKRSDDHTPSGADESVDLAKYDAYYYIISGLWKSENEVTDDKVEKEAIDDKAEEEISNDSKKRIYFTFDCGYENGYTEKILDILKANGAKACFFVTQTYIRDNPEIVKRMKEAGHLVGNHTITHPSMPEISVSKQIDEINGCAEYMKETTGYEMDLYFRPPCGEYSERTLAVAKSLGYKTIFWSIAFLDYDVDKQPGVEYVVNHFRKYHHDGAIVLLHNVSESDTGALDTVLKELKEEGYEFCGLDGVQ